MNSTYRGILRAYFYAKNKIIQEERKYTCVYRYPKKGRKTFIGIPVRECVYVCIMHNIAVFEV